MADIIDQANDIAADFVEKSLQEHKAAVSYKKFPYKEDEGDFHCRECGELVPPMRRKVTSSEYCINCQEDLDKNK